MGPVPLKTPRRGQPPWLGEVVGGVSEEIPRTAAEANGHIFGVVDRALVERKTTATNTAVEFVPQQRELGDLVVEPSAPTGRDSGPVALGWCPVARKTFENFANVSERSTNPLSRKDERDPTDRVTPKSPLTAAGSSRSDKALLVIETDRRWGNATSRRDLANRENIIFVRSHSSHCLKIPS